MSEGEERYKALFETMREGILVVDSNGNITSANPGAARILGYDGPEELIGKPMGSIYLDPSRRKVTLAELKEKGYKDSFEAPMKKKDGAPAYITGSVTVFLDEKGNIDRTEGVFTDITEHKRVEQELRDTQASLKGTFDISPGLICVANAITGQFTECNPAVIRILGFTVEEFTSRPFMEFVHPDDRQRTVDEIEKQLKGSPVANFENRYQCKDGSYKWLAWQATAADENGTVYAVATDITEGKRAEETLRVAHEKYENIVERGNDGIIIIQDKLLKYVNSKMAQMTGYTRDELIGKPYMELIAPGYREGSMDRYRKRVAGIEVSREYEMAVLHKDGNEVAVEINASVTEYEGARADMAIVRDITARKLAEEELKAQKQFTDNVIDSLPDTFYIFDPESGKGIQWNKTLDEISGYSYKEMSQYPPLHFYPPEEHQLIEEAVKTTMEKGHATVELHYIIADGTIIPFEYSTVLIKDADGNSRICAIGRDITERQQAEEELKKTVELLCQTQTIGKVGSWEYDIVTNTPYWSDEVYRIFGLKPQEIEPTFDAYLSYIHPDDRGMVIKAYNDSVKNKIPYDIVHRLMLKDGTIKHVNEKCETYYDSDGKPVRSIGMVQDITERQRMDEALKKKTFDLGERVKELSCLYTISTLTERPDFSLDDVCTEILELIPFGWQYPEITCVRIVVDDQEYKTGNYIENAASLTKDIVIKSEKTGLIEVGYIEEKPEIDEGPFLKEERTLINGIARLLGDYIERKHADEAIRESEEKHRSLFETMTQGVVYQDASGYIFSANSAAEKILGLSIDQMQGRTSLDPRWRSVHEDGTDFSGETHPSMAALKTGKKVNDVIMGVYNPHDDQLHWININAIPQFRPDEKEPYQVYTTFEDITERKQLEEQLKDRSQNLEKMVQERTAELKAAHAKLLRSAKLAAIGQFSAGIAHDLRNPLNIIYNAVYLLKLKLGDGDEKINRLLEMLNEEVNRSNDIISRIMDFARTDEPQLSPIDIYRVINASLSEISIPDDVTVVVEDRGSAADLPMALVDSAQIARVFSNIINNAIQAMPDGGKLTIGVKTTGGFLIAEFEDTGIGIEQENLDKIFEPLFTTKHKTGGTGIGLAASKAIVEAHNGKVEVRSKLNEGTTFTVKLPEADR